MLPASRRTRIQINDEEWSMPGRLMVHALCMAVSLLYLPSAAAGTETLLETRTSWDGGALAYPAGEVKVTSFILRLEEGDVPRFHCHPVPTMGYVLKGRIRVETRDGKTAVFEEGQSVVEVMRTVHRGTAVDGPVEVIVFYAGSTDLPNTVFETDEASDQHCRG
jgi:quercetin dioxygenase-like cupin family protein